MLINTRRGFFWRWTLNAHSTLYGPDQNPRGTDLEDFIFRHGLHAENCGTTPTFQTSQRSSFIDVTLMRDLPSSISGWTVDTRFNGSNNNTVTFGLALGFEYVPSSRPWDRANWGLFTKVLAATGIYVPPRMTVSYTHLTLPTIYSV